MAGTFVGGPLGLAIGGIGGAAGGLARGENIGHALRSGVSNAALTGLGQGVKSGLTGLSHSAAPSVGNAAGVDSGALDALPTDIPAVSTLGDAGSAAAAAPLNPVAAASGAVTGAAASAAPSLASRAGGFLEKHANAVGYGLKGLGSLATAPSENAYRSAQTRVLDAQTQAEEDERKRRLAMQTALGPLAQQLLGQYQSNRPAIPANPYLPPAGA